MITFTCISQKYGEHTISVSQEDFEYLRWKTPLKFKKVLRTCLQKIK